MPLNLPGEFRKRLFKMSCDLFVLERRKPLLPLRKLGLQVLRHVLNRRPLLVHEPWHDAFPMAHPLFEHALRYQ